MAGPFSDWVTRYVARRHGGIRHSEQRLHALWLGAILTPVRHIRRPFLECVLTPSDWADDAQLNTAIQIALDCPIDFDRHLFFCIADF